MQLLCQRRLNRQGEAGVLESLSTRGHAGLMAAPAVP